MQIGKVLSEDGRKRTKLLVKRMKKKKKKVE